MDWRFLPLAGENPVKRPWQDLPLAEPSSGVLAHSSEFVSQKRNAIKYDWQSVGLAQPSPQAVPQDKGRDWKTIPVDDEVAQAVVKKRKACISAASWQELMLSKPADKELNQYETNGMDKKRIQRVFADGCSCKRNCISTLSFADAVGWCQAFHMADQAKRQILLFALYHPDIEWEDKEALTISERHQKTYLEVSGVRVCVAAFCRLLGVSKKTFYKMIFGQPDMRRKEPGAKPTFCPQQAKVDEFLRDIYQSAAEPLAIGFHSSSDSICVSWLCLISILQR